MEQHDAQCESEMSKEMQLLYILEQRNRELEQAHEKVG
jgi:hypothetical protein